ncbi:hypothetical protein WJ32_27555 [Burkholderia ubonensis]|uniref:Uncharacterized protein n=1 Tax=Burkholderia ubonensis TaxID=101571 RepID=A0A103RPH8_9BURK|nr:hypothetical protein [Burkholderia ubonensis]AOJ66156.1 hypothetical protein WJ32_27555 [Burkholderia ubonensis]KVG71603.1 hypothetical protein WJ33_20845 [Burkholderia ubonensis]
MHSITVLCSDGPHHLYLAGALLDAFGKVRVIVEPSRAQARHLRDRGLYRSWLWTHYHALRRRLFGYDALRRHAGVSYVEVESINDASAVDALRAQRCDACIVTGTKRIGPAVLDAIPAARVLNVHGDSSETLHSRAERGAIDRLVASLLHDSDVSRWHSEPQAPAGRTWRMRDRSLRVELVHHLLRRPQLAARAAQHAKSGRLR